MRWVELARTQACKGHVDHAKRSMKVALQLAPTNRHVLRSAARLYFQFGEPDVAHDLVKRNPATPRDPWLMSAEVALSEFSGAKSLFLKKGLELVENEVMIPAQITELAGAVGTILLKDGSGRRGRKLMRLSLGAPTSNSLAQAEWVSVRYREKVMDEKQLQRASGAWEAKAIQAFYSGAFELALHCAELWMEEEQYNLFAYGTAASFANVIENFDKAKDIASKGLALKKDAPGILNALAFAAACQGDLIRASDYLARLPMEDDTQNAIADANRGLIAMRTGKLDEGRKHYRSAIASMRRIENHELEASATVYFAYELARAGLADESADTISTAKEKNRFMKLASVDLIIQRIKRLPSPLDKPRTESATPPHSSHGRPERI
jgi:tetratricopeptide (TPR) repeat protein